MIYPNAKYKKPEGKQGHLPNGMQAGIEQKEQWPTLYMFYDTKMDPGENVCLCSQNITCAPIFKPPFPVVETPAFPLFAQWCSGASRGGEVTLRNQAQDVLGSTDPILLCPRRSPICIFLNWRFGTIPSEILLEAAEQAGCELLCHLWRVLCMSFQPTVFSSIPCGLHVVTWQVAMPTRKILEGFFCLCEVCCHRNTKASLCPQVPKLNSLREIKRK